MASISAALTVGSVQAQTSSGQSDYIFRYNTGVSQVLLSDMTFKSESPLNLGACTVNEKLNGPISCVMNCNNEAVCLLEVSGPSGAGVSDVMEKASETPVTSASPSPQVSGNPYGLGLVSGGGFTADKRAEAYNSR